MSHIASNCRVCNQIKTLDGVYLTKREIECVNWLIKGKSACEISIILEISEKTVIRHLENIKKKLRCYKQFQLGYMIGKYPSLICDEKI